jgi:ribosomal protein S18 acetylase RimI-like enzyme
MTCFHCGEKAWYRCARSGAFLCPRHATLRVVAGGGKQEVEPWLVRAASATDYTRLQELAQHFWGETDVECFDRHYDVLKLPAFVGLSDGEVAGLLSYAIEEDRMVVVMLAVAPLCQGRDLGSRLLASAVREAEQGALSRVVVATSNDDLPALALYQRAGFAITEVITGRLVEHHGRVEEGFSGIPVRDEIRLDLLLR